MKERPIQYEPHPVSPERKAEIIAAGFRIIDAKFKPADAAEGADDAPTAPVKKPRAKPGPKPKAAANAD